jgi:hypothetical protein
MFQQVSSFSAENKNKAANRGAKWLASTGENK